MTSQIEFKFKYQIKLSGKEQKFERFKNSFFHVFNWTAIGLIGCFSFFTGVGQTNLSPWNMTLYCDSEKFNQELTPVSKKWPIICILALTSIVVGIMSIKMIVFQRFTKDIMNIVNFFVGFLLAWNLTYILQNVFSYPIPSFYQNVNLKHHYCCNTCQISQSELNLKLKELDLASRGSFPSFLMCSASYTTTCFYLFVSYLDPTKTFVAKTLVFLLPSFIFCAYGLQLWQQNHNHPEDIICGSLIGMYLAYYSMRNLISAKNDLERFKQDFVSVLMAREMELGLDSSSETSDNRNGSYNQYTINLYPHASSVAEPDVISEMSDQPPPYSSI